LGTRKKRENGAQGAPYASPRERGVWRAVPALQGSRIALIALADRCKLKADRYFIN